jgi:hypothetical protein
MRRIALGVLLLCLLAQAEPPATPAPGELDRLTTLIEEMTALKNQVTAMQTRIEEILRTLSEQRGAVSAPRPGYNAITGAGGAAANSADTPDPKKPVVRCAALTSTGTRCTRAAADGSRYCKQHMLARQK